MLASPSLWSPVAVYARRFAAVVHYSRSFSPEDEGWTVHPRWSETWVHPDRRDALLQGASARWRVSFHTAYEGGAERAMSWADTMMGQRGALLAMFPTSIRVAVRILDPALVPGTRRRVARVVPGPAEAPWVIDLGGVHVELRLTTTTSNGASLAFAEAVFGRPHVDARGRPRAMMFRDDVVRFAIAADPSSAATFLARAAWYLVDFVARRADVIADERVVQATEVAVARLGADGAAEFVVTIATNLGKRAFVLTSRPPYLAVPTNVANGYAA